MCEFPVRFGVCDTSFYTSMDMMEKGLLNAGKIPCVEGGLYGNFDWTYKSVQMLKNPDTGLDIINNRRKKSVDFTKDVKKYDGMSMKFKVVDEIMKGYRAGIYNSVESIIDMGLDHQTLIDVHAVFEDAYARVYRSYRSVPLDTTGALSYIIDRAYIPSIQYILNILKAAYYTCV